MQNSLIHNICFTDRSIYASGLVPEIPRLTKYAVFADLQDSLIHRICLTNRTDTQGSIYIQATKCRDPMITRFATICRVRWCARFTDLQDFLIHRICRICWFAGFAGSQDMLDWHKLFNIYKWQSTQDPWIGQLDTKIPRMTMYATICRIWRLAGLTWLRTGYVPCVTEELFHKSNRSISIVGLQKVQLVLPVFCLLFLWKGPKP